MWHVLPTVKEIDSTNNHLKDNSGAYPHRTVLRALYQTHGRGQFSRQWESVPGENLLLSFLLKNIPLSETENIRSWVVRSLLRWLASFNIKGEFKKPNDILAGGRKILGILIETKQVGPVFEWVVIGIGVNINQTIFDANNATSVHLLINHKTDTDTAYQKLLETMDEEYTL